MTRHAVTSCFCARARRTVTGQRTGRFLCTRSWNSGAIWDRLGESGRRLGIARMSSGDGMTGMGGGMNSWQAMTGPLEPASSPPSWPPSIGHGAPSPATHKATTHMSVSSALSTIRPLFAGYPFQGAWTYIQGEGVYSNPT